MFSDTFGGGNMGLFWKSTFLDRDVEAWCLEAWAWLMRCFGGVEQLRATPLVLPTADFFPPTDAVGEARGRYIFEQVRALMGMADWPCVLEAAAAPPERHRVGAYGMVNHRKSAAGTFQLYGNQARIRYASGLEDRPRELIPVLAHELSHYRLSGARGGMPGGEELHELTTDLMVAFAGFGVFAANSASAFEQHQDAFGQGWSMRRHGYLSDRTWAFALALFAALKGVELPREHLKPAIADMARGAEKYLKRQPQLLEPLRAIAGGRPAEDPLSAPRDCPSDRE